MGLIPDFIIKQSSKETIYEQIVNQVKFMVSNRELKTGDAMPSVRNLAKSLDISTLSVQRAYKELQEEGVIESIEGKGSFVAENLNYSNLRESLIKEVEEEAKRIINIASKNGIELQELQDLISILWEERNE